MKYDLYDFDGTIYNGDSGKDIIVYAIKKYPKFIFVAISSVILYIFKIIKKKEFKCRMYSFVKYIDNIDDFVIGFWNKHEKKINEFWLNKKTHKSDIIISASGFWLDYIADKYKIAGLICTKYDLKTGEMIGNNCAGDEKVRRFYEEYPNSIIDKMYTDSLDDLPLINISNESFIVKNGRIITFMEYKSSK